MLKACKGNNACWNPVADRADGCLLQGFAAVQASVVHLQGVPLSKRFALVPLGPPLLSYSSTAKVRHWMFTSMRFMLSTECSENWCINMW